MTSQSEGPPGTPEPSGVPEPSGRPARKGRRALGRIVTPGAALTVFVLLCALLVEGFTTKHVGLGPVAIHFGADGTAPPDTARTGPQTSQAQTVARQAGALPTLAFNYQGIELGLNGFTDTLTLCNVSQRGSLVTGAMVIGDPEGDGDGQFVGAIGPSGSFALDVQEPYRELSADVYQGSVAPDGEINGIFKYDSGTGVTGTWIVAPIDGAAPLSCAGDA